MNSHSDFPWWKEAVVYQVYPRSFKDSNGDGVGDLKGIIEKLDYLAGTKDSLGIDAIWFSPIYPSPMYDFGYDISDYENIDPVFGDMDTFRALLKECHARNVKVIMDLVVNHTSHLHPWFIESRSSRDNPKRNWYIWKDGKKGKVPNNWMAAFGGSAWEWDEKTESYYYHGFTIQQPDLNWRNPEVKKAIFEMIQFWLDLGVDGFRLDVVNYYFKDAEFRNNPRNFFKGLREYERQYHIYDRNRPETHEVLKEFRKLLDSYPGDKMSVGEVFQEPPGTAELPASFCGKNDELHMAFNFTFLYTKWNPAAFAKVIEEQEKALGDIIWPNYTLSNHDQPRHFSRYKKGKHGVQRAKVAAAMLLTLRGTPFLYYGEEIGMESEWIPRKYIQDPLGKRYWPFFVGRDRARQPMCWTNEEYAGFSSVEPWLPVSKNKHIINVECQEKDPNSLLSFYKSLIALRKKEIALRRGSLRLIIKDNPYILGYERIYENEKILVLLNFSDKERRFPSPENLPLKGKVLLSTYRATNTNYDLGMLQLYPYEVNILRLK